MKSKMVLLLGLVLVIVGGTIAWICASSHPEEEQDAVAAKAKTGAQARRERMKKKNARARTTARGEKIGVKAVTPGQKPERPRLAGKDDAEKELTVPQKAVLIELQSALDKDDIKAVRSVIEQYKNKELRTDKGDVPVALRARAVEALGWFGKDAAIDLIGYLGDPSSEVQQDALSQFEMALEDSEMSDRERSAIVTAAMRAITDPEVIDTLFMQLDNMRNSVRAAAISEILQNGSATAKKMMTEQVEDFTDEGVKTVKGVQQWLVENPDSADDDDFYGKSTDASDATSTPEAQVK